LLSLATSTYAVQRIELDHRIWRLTADFQALQQKMTKAIPADDLRRAYGIILLDRTKAGLIFAYQGGSGVAMVKEPNTQQWGHRLSSSLMRPALGSRLAANTRSRRFSL